ncbi:MAG: hypothetical protein E3K37_15265 [Candidatus Kuenenia sp.]|nr:hypothetical protein [Candidatus Kuenenia hertensis]
MLKTISQAAEKEISVGMQKLKMGNTVGVRDHAMRSWQLKKSANAAKLVFLANIAEKKYEEALQ